MFIVCVAFPSLSDWDDAAIMRTQAGVPSLSWLAFYRGPFRLAENSIAGLDNLLPAHLKRNKKFLFELLRFHKMRLSKNL